MACSQGLMTVTVQYSQLCILRWCGCVGAIGGDLTCTYTCRRATRKKVDCDSACRESTHTSECTRKPHVHAASVLVKSTVNATHLDKQHGLTASGVQLQCSCILARCALCLWQAHGSAKGQLRVSVVIRIGPAHFMGSTEWVPWSNYY
jgi:hypothetical protein